MEILARQTRPIIRVIVLVLQVMETTKIFDIWKLSSNYDIVNQFIINPKFNSFGNLAVSTFLLENEEKFQFDTWLMLFSNLSQNTLILIKLIRL